MRNIELGFGIPVAFLLTNSSAQQVFSEWFGELKKKLKELFDITYQPEVVVTDQGNVEILAIRTAFPLTKIHYCAWHVLRAWERQFTNTNLEISTLNNEQKIVEREKVIYSVVKAALNR